MQHFHFELMVLPGLALEKKNFYWIFGKPWFEKYLMVFNQDKKTIGHYCYILNDSDTKKISPTLNPLLLTNFILT